MLGVEVGGFGRIMETIGHRVSRSGSWSSRAAAATASPPRAARRRRPPVPRRARRPRCRHRIVRFRAGDGRRLHGELTPAERRHAPAVVLVHGLYGEPGQWDDFVGHLHRAGFATLAYASRSADEVDEAVLARDLTGAVRTLRARPEVDPDRIVLAGASVGGSTVAYALGTQPDLPVRGGVGFSAVEGPREVALSKRHAFRPHDLLLISDQPRGRELTQPARRRARQGHNDLRRRDDRPRRRAAARRERARPRDRLAQAADGLNSVGVATGGDDHGRVVSPRCAVGHTNWTDRPHECRAGRSRCPRRRPGRGSAGVLAADQPEVSSSPRAWSRNAVVRCSYSAGWVRRPAVWPASGSSQSWTVDPPASR